MFCDIFEKAIVFNPNVITVRDGSRGYEAPAVLDEPRCQTLAMPQHVPWLYTEVNHAPTISMSAKPHRS
jgi:hypothetical protein